MKQALSSVRYQAVILAGGLATRLGNLTAHTPKFLLPVQGRPFAAWLLEHIRRSGYHDVVLCIGHWGEQIERFVGNGSAFGLAVRYANEGDSLRGTGGALALAASLGELDETFLVTYGDSFLPFDYAAPLQALRTDETLQAVLSVYKNEGRWGASNVALTSDERLVTCYHKGASDLGLHYIDYGAMALRRSTLSAKGSNTSFGLDELQRELAWQGGLGAYLAEDRFYEIGSHEGLADFTRYLPRRAGGPF